MTKIVTPSDITAYLRIRDRGEHNKFALCKLTEWAQGLKECGIQYYISVAEIPFSIPQEHQSKGIIYNSYFTKDPRGIEINSIVDHSAISASWRGAAKAHFLPYAHCETKYVISIDADDTWNSIPYPEFITRAIEAFSKVETPVLSYDVYFSVSIRPDKRPHHWSFGVTIADTKQMHDIVRAALLAPRPPDVGWCNIDYLVDYWLEQNTTYPIGMIARDSIHNHGFGQQIIYDSKTDEVIQKYFSEIETRKKRHSRVIVF